MMQYYNNYLRTRLEQGRGSSTVIDRAIVLAIDEFGAKDNFVTAVSSIRSAISVACSATRRNDIAS